MASTDPTKKLISDLAQLLSRELLLSVPEDEFPGLVEAAEALSRTQELLGEETPEMARDFLEQFNKLKKTTD